MSYCHERYIVLSDGQAERMQSMAWISKYEMEKGAVQIVTKICANETGDDDFKGKKKRQQNFREKAGVSDPANPIPTAVAIGHNKQSALRLNPIVRALLVGTYDQGSSLKALQGQDLIWSEILAYLRAFWSEEVVEDGIFASQYRLTALLCKHLE